MCELKITVSETVLVGLIGSTHGEADLFAVWCSQPGKNPEDLALPKGNVMANCPAVRQFNRLYNAISTPVMRQSHGSYHAEFHALMNIVERQTQSVRHKP